MTIQLKKKRCPNGTRKNKIGDCVETKKNKSLEKIQLHNTPEVLLEPTNAPNKMPRCKKGTHRDKKTKHCVSITAKIPTKHVTPSKPDTVINANRTGNVTYAEQVRNIINKYAEQVSNIMKNFGNSPPIQIVNIKRIGIVSCNGAVLQLTLNQNNLLGLGLFKIIGKIGADNLLYEYMVGLFLNGYTKRFPCFVETYSIWTLTKHLSNFIRTTKKTIPPATFKTHAKLLYRPAFENNDPLKYYTTDEITIEESCTTKINTSTGIMTQFITGNTVYGTILTQHGNIAVAAQLHEILYQVYSVLACMEDIFTHYDLHAGNVMLSKLLPSECVEFVYHSANDDNIVTTFKTNAVCKIIDYGRCYFNAGQHGSSQDIKHIVCAAAECNRTETCGYGDGYFFKHHPPNKKFNINTGIRNRTADLRFACSLCSINNVPNIHAQTLLKHLAFSDQSVYYQVDEMEPSKNPQQYIRTVGDLHKYLTIQLRNPSNQLLNATQFAKFKNIYTIHVYESGLKNMEIIYH